MFFILFQILFHYGLLQDIADGSLCYTVGPCCSINFFFFYKFIYLFIYLFLAVLGLRLCARALSSCGERGPLFIAVRGPLTVAAAAHRPSCSAARGILPDQGSNPRPLHWQADSQPLRHRRSPSINF